MIPANCLALLVSSLFVAAPAAPAEVSGGPYCGVYCVYATATMHGKAVAFDSLLTQDYVGSFKGSTVAELRRAVEGVGLVPTAMTGLTPAALRASPHPVILHVRRPGRAMPFAHWVVYAGEENGAARIVDPPAGVELVPFSELAALWDGVGVVVSPEAPHAAPIRLAAYTESVGLILAVVAALALGRRFAPSSPRGGSVVTGVAILAVGAAVGVGSQLVSGDGLLRDRAAVGMVAGQHFQPAIREVDAAEAEALVARPGVGVVDARTPADYSAGHLPGAVNLPVFAGLAERRAVAEGLPREGTVVVYCQSEGCKWADAVAADLYHRGVTGVVIFRGGWRGWHRDA